MSSPVGREADKASFRMSSNSVASRSPAFADGVRLRGGVYSQSENGPLGCWVVRVMKVSTAIVIATPFFDDCPARARKALGALVAVFHRDLSVPHQFMERQLAGLSFHIKECWSCEGVSHSVSPSGKVRRHVM